MSDRLREVFQETVNEMAADPCFKEAKRVSAEVVAVGAESVLLGTVLGYRLGQGASTSDISTEIGRIVGGHGPSVDFPWEGCEAEIVTTMIRKWQERGSPDTSISLIVRDMLTLMDNHFQ